MTESDLFVRLPRVLAKHGFLIEGSEQHSRAYHFETQWRYRKPFTDELELGATEARTRLRLRAARAGRRYVLHFEAENMVLTPAGRWARKPVTRSFEAYACTVASAIRMEVAGGIRRY